MSSAGSGAHWGDQIAVEVVGGIALRMYTERPQRLDEVLTFADRWGERPHLVLGDQVITFAQFRRAIAAQANALCQHGMTSGARVFLLGWNSPEWAINFWACLQIGAVPVLANAWWSAAEVANGLATLQPALVLADDNASTKLEPRWRNDLWASDCDPLQNAATTAPASLSRNEEDTGVIVFTSGTSGQPKAVVLSHRAALARLHMTLHVTRKLPQQLDGTGHDVTLLTGPLFHVGTMQALLRAVVVGDTLVLLPGRFDPAQVLASIERYKVKRWNAVPTMVSRVLEHPDVTRRDVSSLKSISIGGAPVHADLMRRIRLTMPTVSPKIPTGYGLTENGGQATAAAGTENIELLGSTGKPLACVEISFLVHPDLPDGEVLLRAPTQMSGYYGMTESPIDSEGWLHTGDLGRLDDKGNLWITGRCKDMIIRGGENIAPVAVERALAEIKGVIEAAVVGMPHADLGEEVMAFVHVEGDLDGQQLQQQLRDRIASFSIPTRWHIQHEALPTNPTGKVDKAALRALLAK